jgi:hypothetical protein
MTHAPWVNFVTAMTMSTMNDSTAPVPFTKRPHLQPSSRSRRWCFAIPACDSVNDVNTPIA